MGEHRLRVAIRKFQQVRVGPAKATRFGMSDDCQITVGGILKPTPKVSPERRVIQSAIRTLKAEMRERGVRRISCFNGGLTDLERRYNTEFFNLNTQLERTP
jgi:hypothetical protein